ncbi:MAG: AI-2E family transporter [Acidobacteria bacterium]|jgi:predicted PurR-regulated permease PerM|nr:AI-2E family transporter [Acidobacteriota bacterium]
MGEINKFNHFVKRLLIICAVITLIILGVFFISYIVDVLMLAFAAVLLAIFLRGLADLLNRYVKISEGKAVLLVSLLLVIILAVSIALLAPSVAEQVRHLRDELPKSAQTLSANLSQYDWGRAIIENLPSTDDVLTRISTANWLSSVGGFFSSTVGMIANFFIAILVAIYLASEPQTYIHGFTKLFPLGRRARVREVLAEIGETLQWWLVGKSGSMLVIGILTWIGLSIIGVPLALTLGLIAGLLSFIPNFGPILSAIPAILLAFIESPVSALYVIGLYVGIQLFESNLVTPWIERQTVELPPALTILSQLTLAVLIGGLGLVLATPVLAVIMVLVQMLYIQDVLGDKETEINKENKLEIQLEDLEMQNGGNMKEFTIEANEPEQKL